ncbi:MULTISPECIES: hypothetical protein [unclassified Marinovum]
MSDHTNNDHIDRLDREHTNTTTTTTTNSGGNGGMAFIVGILVVIVAVLAWVMFAGGDIPGGSSGSSDLNVNIESTAPAAEPAPAEGATEAPVDAQ